MVVLEIWNNKIDYEKLIKEDIKRCYIYSNIYSCLVRLKIIDKYSEYTAKQVINEIEKNLKIAYKHLDVKLSHKILNKFFLDNIENEIKVKKVNIKKLSELFSNKKTKITINTELIINF